MGLTSKDYTLGKCNFFSYLCLMEKEMDSNPAFHKMGFDDEEDQKVWIELKKYSEIYKNYIARGKFGDNKSIHNTYDKRGIKDIKS